MRFVESEKLLNENSENDGKSSMRMLMRNHIKRGVESYESYRDGIYPVFIKDGLYRDSHDTSCPVFFFFF